MKKQIFFLILVLITFTNLSPLMAAQITRVIVASDTHPDYIQFWPLVAASWKQIVGIRPTLFLIAEEDFPIDTSCGDVIRFKPIPGIPTSLQAQVIRLLGAVYFENEVCLISDIDMIPCSKSYFLDSVRDAPSDHYIVYRNGHDKGMRFPMCYNAAKGSVVKAAFGINSPEEIPNKIIEWAKLGLEWNTDELVLTKIIKNYKELTGKVTYLNHNVDRRIDRLDILHKGYWRYNQRALQNGEYIDAHLMRPLDQYRKINYQVVRDLGIKQP